ncbi:MAG TPA: glycosyltransferase [bacterium]|nr:glycosyltransferase [bacterium]
MTEPQKPLVSIIIPTRNRCEKLREAVDSALAQEGSGTTFEVEVIVVDDASTDATPHVVPRWPGLRYQRLEQHANVSTARNAGIAMSRGDYIAFLDDDDLLLPGFVRTLLAARADVAYGAVITERDGVREAHGRIPHPSGDVFLDILYHNFYIQLSALLFRREVVADLGGFDETLPAMVDHDLLLRIAHHHRFVYVPGTVAVYRQSSGGLWRSTVRTGHHFSLLRRVYERALTLHPLPDRTKRAVLDDAYLYALKDAAAYLPPNGPVSDVQDHVVQILACLREHPRLARYPQYRHIAAHVARALAVTRSADAARAFTVELCRVEGRTFQANRLVARAWVEIGIGLCLVGQWKNGCGAFLVAASRDPTQFLARLANVMHERARRANFG